MQRCTWLNLKNSLYVEYHDNEWWEAVYDENKLFEMLILEWAQAGLSWETVLNKRENYRQAFDNFDPEKVSKYDEKKSQELLQNAWIIRNRLKISSTIKNATVFLEIQKEFWSFSKYIWWFVDNTPIINTFETLKEYPNKTEISDKISKDLKKRWMNFVGTTIIYSFMQAIWMSNDHQKWCFKCKR